MTTLIRSYSTSNQPCRHLSYRSAPESAADLRALPQNPELIQGKAHAHSRAR